MPSTNAVSGPLVAGYTGLPGLQLSPQGAILTSLKAYSFGIVSTSVVTATSTAITYTVSGLTTADIPIALQPSTGVAPGGLGIGTLSIVASSQLIVQWIQNGTSTSGIPGVVAPGTSYQLLTYSYYAQSSSTTT